MRQFSEEEVRRLLPMKDAIAVLRQAFADYAAGKAKNQPRRRLYLDTGAVLHSLAGAWGKYFGTKVYATHAKHGAWFTVMLFDAETARPLAQMEANWLGQIRTGAVSGLAVDLLAKPGGAAVGCIGSGFQAQSQLEAIAAVRPIRSVRVWSRRAEKREKFAAEMAALLAVPVAPADSAASAAAGADILVTATYSKDPVIAAESVPDGTLVLAMGSNNAQRRELPSDLVQDAFVVVEDLESCRSEAGDLLLALEEEDWKKVVELKQLVANPLGTAQTSGRVTVFKSVGMGLEDVAAAALVYEHAGD
jgi:ornithine cyclodeaminase/alanine dehydrogenase-like protein (mu-crystallin family)